MSKLVKLCFKYKILAMAVRFYCDFTAKYLKEKKNKRILFPYSSVLYLIVIIEIVISARSCVTWDFFFTTECFWTGTTTAAITKKKSLSTKEKKKRHDWYLFDHWRVTAIATIGKTLAPETNNNTSVDVVIKYWLLDISYCIPCVNFFYIYGYVCRMERRA